MLLKHVFVGNIHFFSCHGIHIECVIPLGKVWRYKRRNQRVYNATTKRKKANSDPQLTKDWATRTTQKTHTPLPKQMRFAYEHREFMR